MTLNGNWSRESGESRTEEYRDWRTRIGCGAAGDADQFEYDAETGRPLLLIELCVADRRSEAIPKGVRPGCDPSPLFFDKVEEKINAERPQGRLLRHIAEKLGIPILQVVYIKGELTRRVWVKRADKVEWKRMTLAEYEQALRSLHQKGRR